ncbi:MAG: hypothetical protein KJP03_07600, partial [Gammaproteobacteria bacterium]|nr:hypothetical protein [Gammaproteobacteria bacterium]
MVVAARKYTLVLIAVAAQLLAAPGSAAPLSLDDVAAMRSVSQPRMSPTGKHVAYLLRVPRELYVEDDGPAHRHLYVSDLEGAATPFVTDDIEITDLAWSASGDAVYFLAKRDADAAFNSLYRIDLAGGEAEQVFTHENAIARIYPSPDGKTLAFIAGEAPPAKSKELAAKGFKAVVYEESARPSFVWLLNLDAGAVTQQALPGSASDLAWAADGDSYAVALAPTPLVDDGFINRDIYVVHGGKGAVTAQVGLVGKLGQFALSPDGTHVAYIGSVDKHDPREGRLYLYSLTDDATTELVPDYPGHVSQVRWLDNTRVRWAGYRGMYSDYAVADINDPQPMDTAAGAGPIVHAMHSHPGLDAAAVVADTPEHPRELFVLRDGAEPQRLTFSNPWLADRELAEQQVIRYPARDGLELEAVLISPLNKRAKRAPLI